MSRLFEVCSAFRPWFPPREWLESCLLCLQSPCFCCFFLLRTASSRSLFARRSFALRPCVYWCALCFRLNGLKDVCLLLMYLSQEVACVMCLFVKLLVFPLGAASSRSACAAVLRPEPFCLLACYSAVEIFLLSRILEVCSPCPVLLAFSPGAAASRFGCAAVLLLPAPLLCSSPTIVFYCNGCGRTC